jgi:hypothetical protein
VFLGLPSEMVDELVAAAKRRRADSRRRPSPSGPF